MAMKNGKNTFGPLLLIAGAIGAPIIAAQVVKGVIAAPKTPQEAADAVTKGVYAYGGLAAGLAVLAGYTSGATQAAAVGAALSTGILAGHAASVLLAIPKEALKPGEPVRPPVAPGALGGGGLPGIPGTAGLPNYARRA